MATPTASLAAPHASRGLAVPASVAALSVEDVVRATRGRLRAGSPSATFRGLSTDTRSLQPGQAFLAMAGPTFDGHTFLEAAIARGASGLIVQTGAGPAEAGALPVIEVAQTVTALGDLALAHRRRFNIPVIAITGSCGKTTTKEMIAAVVGASRCILSSAGTENNHIGVPQTLLRLRPEHAAVVLEMGTNHPEEIARLAAIAEPTIGLVTNIGVAHLEFFGSIGGVLREKLSLLRALPADGTAMIPGDDLLVRRALIEQPVDATVVSCGAVQRCDVQARRIEPLATGSRVTIDGPIVPAPFTVELPLLGRHNALNALMAVACGLRLGISPWEITLALEALRPMAMRLEPLRVGQIVMLSDCYNANPTSMRQAIDVLRAYPQDGPRFLVCGDMAELGAGARQFHREVGRYAGDANLDAVIAVGTYASCTVEGLRSSARPRTEGWACATLEDVQARLLALPLTHGTVLVKGSRVMGMERLVAWLAGERP